MSLNPASAGNNDRKAWLAAAWIAGLFCMAICATMLLESATATTNDPWKSPQLRKLHAELVAAPKDAQLKAQIRELDLKYRQRFFRRLALDRVGGWLLLSGIAVFVVSARQASTYKAPSISLPNPQSSFHDLLDASRARWSVAIAGATIGLSLTAVVMNTHTGLPSSVDGIPQLLGKSPAGAPLPPKNDLPSLVEFQSNWPRFRGPDGSGFSPKSATPLDWDEHSNKGILWKSAIPAPGFNSPIVWGNRVFISGGTAEKREVFCYDAADGKLVWQRAIENVPDSPANPPKIMDETGYAAPTMATDGRRVFVIFANGDLAAVAFDGTVIWSKNLGVPKNQYGHATSLAVWQDKLIVQLDQGESGPANSRLTAFDGATGKVVWEKARKVPGSWASPIVVEAAGKVQIITAAVPSLIAYSVTDGAELWKADVLEGEIAPSPILAGRLVCGISPTSKLTALRPDGTGDVTKTHIAWENEENIPDVTTPASNGELIFYITSSGMLTCLDAKDGAKQWEHDFGTEFQSSPGIAGNHVYVFSTDGHAWVVDAGRTFKELGEGMLEDKFFASPAFVGGRLFLRGNARLYCIGEK